MEDFFDDDEDEAGKLKEFKKEKKEKDFDQFLKQKRWSRQSMDEFFGGE